MADSNGSVPPPQAGPALPADKLPMIPTEAELAAAGSETVGGDLSNSPWAKMFPGGATKEQLNEFIQMYIRSLVTQMHHDERVHKENLEKQRIREQGGIA